MHAVQGTIDGRGASARRGGLTQILGAAALALLAASAAAGPAADPAGQDDGKLRYVQAGPSGARARNLYDAQGLVVRDVPPGMILAVYGERAGWLDVEAPGGFKVWVYGQYVRPGKQAGMVAITGSSVRMRPLASSGPESLPLLRKLDAGEEVRLIQRQDESVALDQDWVQVWSPPGARAWVRADEVVPVATGTDGARLWAEAVAAIAGEPRAATLAGAPAAGTPAPAAAPAPSQTQDNARATDLLRKADQLLAQERHREEQGGQPNYAVVVGAFEEVLAVAPSGPTADIARGRIQLAKSYADAYQIRADLESQKVDYEQKLKERDAKMAAAGERDVFEGRFAERGWLERRLAPGGSGDPIWVLHFAGGDAAELSCSSGRYDIELFTDFEIGVNGAVARGPLAGDLGAPARPRLIDVSSIEVISGRTR